MPKIDIASVPALSKTIYPEPYAKATEGREKQALGDGANLTQFGVNLTRLKPGAGSALKHWHENEDEFVFILEGEAVLLFRRTAESRKERVIRRRRRRRADHWNRGDLH